MLAAAASVLVRRWLLPGSCLVPGVLLAEKNTWLLEEGSVGKRGTTWPVAAESGKTRLAEGSGSASRDYSYSL